ncbi:cupin domain-containing protein [Thioalkalivibrio sp. HK1]|uniref:cupin domain-containing protein n=1 Tax=Thioalkalivibrio sp. HK1 TaxID=1469245 RepID=UPI000470153C|nr:cupin domain-containing protein [Thioalkalivibrio sp. HK1]
MTEKSERGFDFVHAKASEALWNPGLREIFEYRDLGIEKGTGGRYIAHIIRANGKKADDEVQKWHRHHCDFQLVLVLEGWGEFEYEGQGIHRLEPGDCVLQPPKIRHREIACSEDFKVLEIVSPANFSTEITKAP